VSQHGGVAKHSKLKGNGGKEAIEVRRRWRQGGDGGKEVTEVRRRGNRSKETVEVKRQWEGLCSPEQTPR
jgi:hypothetical protein